MKKGLLIILSGPSGVGKGTIRKYLMENFPELNLHYSVSMTTRQPRNSEMNGVDYFFITNEEFDHNIELNNFLEYSAFVGNRYGTPRDYVYRLLNSGKNVLLEIETNGAKQVLSKVKDDKNHVSIFLTADIECLKNRIINRKTESEDIIIERLNKAKAEFNECNMYDFVVENDTVSKAANCIAKIISDKIVEINK